MSPHREPASEVDEVARLLEPLARGGTAVPSADAVYWRAQAHAAIEASNRRRRAVLRPLRLFHLTLGGAAIGLGVLTSVSPLFLAAGPGIGPFSVPLLLAAVTAGAWLLTEAEAAS